MTSVKLGTLSTYDLDRGRGVVTVEGEDVPFSSTYFRSGRPTRDPKQGDEVEVLYSANGDVILVRPRSRVTVGASR